MVAPPDNDLLLARSLRHSLRGSPALLGASLAVRRGEILGVVGPRGAGKTTLLRCLSGQLVADQGEVWFDGRPVHELPEPAREVLRRERFGWVGSEPDLLAELTGWENAALPLLVRGVRSRTARATALEWLDRLDVGAAARKRPGSLTRAEQQRVAVARALVGSPAVVLADDAAAPLHHPDRAQVLRTLASAARSHGMTVVLAGTDPDTAQYADRSVALRDGRTDGVAAFQGRTAPDPAPATA